MQLAYASLLSALLTLAPANGFGQTASHAVTDKLAEKLFPATKLLTLGYGGADLANHSFLKACKVNKHLTIDPVFLESYRTAAFNSITSNVTGNVAKHSTRLFSKHQLYQRFPRIVWFE